MKFEEAVRKYVNTLNEIPYAMIEQSMKDHPEDWWEVTKTDETFYQMLPIWGTMYQFDDMCDHHWMEEENGVEEMSKIGFRIYEHREWGYFFGMDATCQLYENYWMPLYKVRGIHWHNEE